MIMDRLPRCVQAFFTPFRRRLSKPQFHHLWSLVLAWAVNLRQAKVTHLAGLLAGRHRTARGRFLSDSDWDAADLLDRQAFALLGRMRPRRGEVIYLVIDDTRIAKRGRKMAGLSKIWDHAAQRFVRGHLVVTAAMVFRGVALPWRFVVWQPKKLAGRDYRKITEIAARMVRDFTAPEGLRVRVLFDAFYLSPVVTQACAESGFHWFSVAARNRAITREGGPKRKLADAAPGWLRHGGRAVRMRRSRGWAWLRIAAVDGRLSRIGSVRLVVSKRPREPWRTLVVIATNETGLDARTIVAEYEKRWAIEVLFKELRGSLGLGDYQVQSERAIRHHLHLSGLSHQVLTHHSLEAVGAQARKAKQELSLPPLSQRLDALREDLRRERLDRLLKRVPHGRLRTRMKRCLFELGLAA